LGEGEEGGDGAITRMFFHMYDLVLKKTEETFLNFASLKLSYLQSKIS
jgi:hypothetical protein